MLKVRELRVAYGGIAAVKGVDLDIADRETVCLIGCNGAGKTSTLKALARMLPAHGEIRYRGDDIVQWPAHRLIGEGLALVPEGRGVFARLSVLENLAMGAYCRDDRGEIESDLQRVLGLLPRLEERASQLAGTLSGGEQQMLAMGRAMMSRPKLLMLDEPSMGLSPIMMQRIMSTVKTLQSQGTTILLVEQNARAALKLADKGYVLEVGHIVLEGTGHDLLHSDAVRKAYLGED